MTDEEQKLYDVIADWWDEVFVRPQNPNTIRNDCIIDLVHDIIDLKYNNVPEDADPYNLRGRQPMQPVKKQREEFIVDTSLDDIWPSVIGNND